jgi:hypothetical protein
MKFLFVLLLAQCLANSTCVLFLQDGTSFSYKTNVVNTVYPEGLGCDGVNLYTVPDQTPIGCTVNISGTITCGATQPQPLGNQTAQKSLAITIN